MQKTSKEMNYFDFTETNLCFKTKNAASESAYSAKNTRFTRSLTLVKIS